MKLRPLFDRFDDLASHLQSPLLLLIRLYWGWSFAQTGWGKLTHLEKTTAYFADLNLPLPRLNAIAAGSVECIGGLLLALGFFARPASVPLIFTMVVAYVTASSEALHAFFREPDKFVTADPFLYLFAALIVLAFGPGRFSIDALQDGKTGLGN